MDVSEKTTAGRRNRENRIDGRRSGIRDNAFDAVTIVKLSAPIEGLRIGAWSE
jgi:hypothetical protein